jgi:osmotically-inducible protein OsmY
MNEPPGRRYDAYRPARGRSTGRDTSGGFGAPSSRAETVPTGGPARYRSQDERLRFAVIRSLARDRWLDARSVDVRVERGVVTLSGEVGDYMEMRYAWDDAWETPGVQGVVSSLRVSESQPPASGG